MNRADTATRVLPGSLRAAQCADRRSRSTHCLNPESHMDPITNNHAALVSISVAAASERRDGFANLARAYDRVVVGEIINLSAQYAAILDLVKCDRAWFLGDNGTIAEDIYL